MKQQVMIVLVWKKGVPKNAKCINLKQQNIQNKFELVLTKISTAKIIHYDAKLYLIYHTYKIVSNVKNCSMLLSHIISIIIPQYLKLVSFTKDLCYHTTI